jgi:hypothetical protein
MQNKIASAGISSLTAMATKVHVMFMVTPQTLRALRQLTELADASLQLARHLHRRVLLADNPRDKARLAKAYAALVRDFRLTAAREARLIREIGAERDGRLRMGVRRATRRRQETELAPPPPDAVKH